MLPAKKTAHNTRRAAAWQGICCIHFSGRHFRYFFLSEHAAFRVPGKETRRIDISRPDRDNQIADARPDGLAVVRERLSLIFLGKIRSDVRMGVYDCI